MAAVNRRRRTPEQRAAYLEQAHPGAVTLLRAGATTGTVVEETGLSMTTITRIRRLLHIPSPHRMPDGTRTPEQQAAYLQQTHPAAVTMLRNGATKGAVTEETGLSESTVLRIRRLVRIPSPRRVPDGGRTIADVLTLHTQPYGNGHARWTGPTAGREYSLFARGERLNARAEAFRDFYGRDPVGYVRAGCGHSGCIAGAHLTDHTNRTTTPRSTT